jgi:DNA-binding NtrC family response regulator
MSLADIGTFTGVERIMGLPLNYCAERRHVARSKKGIVGQEPQSRLVFVVDDESVIASTLALILQNQGFEARPFTEPLKALQAACFETPDLLITDVVMPLLSGIELATQVKERCPNCKVLLFSGHAATANLLKSPFDSNREFELLTKPVHPSDLINKVKGIFDGNGYHLTAS